MDCNRFQKELMDAALEALDPRREAALKAHLAVCSACRADFEGTERLIRHMDQALQRRLEAEPSPAFAAGVLDRIAREHTTRRAWVAGWVPVAAVALAITVVVTVRFGSRRTAVRDREAAVNGSRTAAGTKQSLEAPLAATAAPVGVRERRARSTHRPDRRAARYRRGPNEPQVLVDKDQWQAVLQLYNDVWSGRVTSAVLPVKQDGDITPKPIEIRPLEIPELRAEFKPLDGVGRGNVP
jgi:hypothetical protein